MSTTITSIHGVKWEIEKSFDDGDAREVQINTLNDSGGRLFRVADVLAAMKAEGVLDAVEIIAELPEVTGDGRSAWADGEAYITHGEWADGSKHRKRALERLAVARYLEAKNAEAAKAEARALGDHRQRIVNRHAFGLGAVTYDSLDVNGKHIVDTIRELEDSLAAK